MRRRVQPLRPVGQQRERGVAALRPADVDQDAAQPGGEPIRVTQPPEPHERLQERVLHYVVHVVWTRAQPGRAGPGHRQMPLD